MAGTVRPKVTPLTRFIAGTLVPAFASLLFAGSPAPAIAAGLAARALVIPARTACDTSGRCYETGDPGYRDDDAPPPRRRYDPDDNDRPVPPPRRRFDPDDDDRPPPPPRRRYDPDDDDRPPPPPRRRYNPDDDDR